MGWLGYYIRTGLLYNRTALFIRGYRGLEYYKEVGLYLGLNYHIEDRVIILITLVTPHSTQHPAVLPAQKSAVSQNDWRLRENSVSVCVREWCVRVCVCVVYGRIMTLMTLISVIILITLRITCVTLIRLITLTAVIMITTFNKSKDVHDCPDLNNAYYR